MSELFAKTAACAWVALMVFCAFLALRPDHRGDCLRFTRELKILQACNAAKSCIFGVKDLKRMDELQTSCQALAQ